MATSVTSQIDGVSAGLAVKAPVHAVATTNVALTGLQTVDGIVLNGSTLYRVLCVAQTDPVDNGIWDASTGSWMRAKDFDGNRDAVHGTLVPKSTGSGGAFYRVTTTNPIVIGTSEIEFESVSETGIPSTGIVYGITPAEIAASVTPTHYAGSSRPWLDAEQRYEMVNDGATDNTAAFTKMAAVAANHAITTPGTYLTGKFTPVSNFALYLAPGVIIKDTGVLGASERFLNLTNDNIHIIAWGAELTMTRADYTTGEQRHGVYIYGGQNITIEGLPSNDCGGDGYYIGGAAGDPATNIRLIGCSADNNRRQALSLVSCRKLRAWDFEGTNTTGTAPSAGIDIEPNATTDVLEDIKFYSPRTKNNDGPGIELFLYAWNSDSNYADIDIINWTSVADGQVSIGGRLRGALDANRIGSTTPCRGRIRVIDPTFIDSAAAAAHIYDWDKNGPLLEIIRPTIINPNQLQGSASTVNGGIILHNTNTYTSTPGNVRIIEPFIRDDDGYVNAGILSLIRVSGKWTDTVITDPKYVWAGTSPWTIDADAAPVFDTTVDIQSAHTSNVTISDGRYLGRLLTNVGAAGQVVWTLPQTTSDMIGWRLTWEVFAAQGVVIDPDAVDVITPLGKNVAAGTLIKSSLIGSRISLVCKQVGYWHIESMSGHWALDAGDSALTQYTITNRTTDRAYDCNATTTDELADALGTLIKDLQDAGVLGGTS